MDEGNPQDLDRILREEIENSLKKFDLVILAQASMGRVVDAMDNQKRKNILTSPPLAVEDIRRRFLTSG